MLTKISLLVLALWAASIVAAPTCTPEQRLAGVKQLVKTIETHSFADAAKIPLAPSVTRVVTV
jgi:hypothetical protein